MICAGYREVFSKLWRKVSVVGKLVWVAVPIVRLNRLIELNSIDRVATFQDCSCYPMHSVHDASVTAEDDGMGHVDFLDQANMLDDIADCRKIHFIVEPIDRVHLAYRSDVHLFDWEASAEADQRVDIPRIKSLASGPEVILLAHTTVWSTKVVSRSSGDASTVSSSRHLRFSQGYVEAVALLVWIQLMTVGSPGQWNE